MKPWIKATTPPDSGRDVLALEDDGCSAIAYYDGDTWFDSRQLIPIFVDYWMPIPRRPKGYEP
jgi:hypothetical protein